MKIKKDVKNSSIISTQELVETLNKLRKNRCEKEEFLLKCIGNLQSNV